MEMGRLCAIAVIAALCALILKKQVPEIALCLSLTAGCLLLWEALDALSAVRGLMDSLARLGRLTGNYRVLPGHMEPSDLDTERRMNPYLIQAMRK